MQRIGSKRVRQINSQSGAADRQVKDLTNGRISQVIDRQFILRFRDLGKNSKSPPRSAERTKPPTVAGMVRSLQDLESDGDEESACTLRDGRASMDARSREFFENAADHITLEALRALLA